MKFLYIESEKIKSMIIENAIDFFSVKEDKMIFAVAGKIFNYPNKIYCVRIVIAYFSCQSQEVFEEDAIDSAESEGKNEVNEVYVNIQG